MNSMMIRNLIIASGIGHIVLSMGSLFVPVALKWKWHLKDLPLLLRQLFWTYAGYILMINLWFGLTCLLGVKELQGDSFLAKSIHLLISIYWLIRIGVQFFYFDKTFAPKGMIYTLGEIILVLLFILFTTIHMIVFCYG